MKLLRRQLHGSLPSLFLLRLTFYFVCCHFPSFKSSLHQRFMRRQNGLRWKLQRCKLVRFSSTQAGWRCCLKLSLSGRQRPGLERVTWKLLLKKRAPNQECSGTGDRRWRWDDYFPSTECKDWLTDWIYLMIKYHIKHYIAVNTIRTCIRNHQELKTQ